MTKLYSKKGQVAANVAVIISLVVGIGVAVMVIILVGSMGGQTYNLVQSDIAEIGNFTTSNYSFLALNNTAVSVGNTNIHEGTLVIMNDSVNVVGLGNFTIDYTAGTATLIENAYNNTYMNATYEWGDLSIQDAVKGGITSSFEALEQTGNYLPLIVLAVIIAVTLTIVLGYTAFGRTGGSGSAL